MSYLIAFLIAVGHDPCQSASAPNRLYEWAFLLGFIVAEGFFFLEFVSS